MIAPDAEQINNLEHCTIVMCFQILLFTVILPSSQTLQYYREIFIPVHYIALYLPLSSWSSFLESFLISSLHIGAVTLTHVLHLKYYKSKLHDIANSIGENFIITLTFFSKSTSIDQN